MAFRFLDYFFDREKGLASFRYEGGKGVFFEEKVEFSKDDWVNFDEEIFDSALFFAFIVIGTSYYKAYPTHGVILSRELDSIQARIFDKIYQEGLSQFAYENGLRRDDLAHFVGSGNAEVMRKSGAEDAVLAMVSGGKDSLLVAEKIRESGRKYKVAYISSYDGYPRVIDDFGNPIVIRRHIDKVGLKKAGGLNGHVPVTLINQALALIQAILLGYNCIEFGIGDEGLEAHAFIDGLPVNHQWSKTAEAQSLLEEYVAKYVAVDIKFASALKGKTELEIAKEFAELCWGRFGNEFSSCNVANYKQNEKNRDLKWCGECAKCANSYLLFAPFVSFEKQQKIFGRDLFTDPKMTEIFKGLLGVGGVMKPFECVASIEELRRAYETRLPGYGKLPFEVPRSK